MSGSRVAQTQVVLGEGNHYPNLQMGAVESVPLFNHGTYTYGESTVYCTCTGGGRGDGYAPPEEGDTWVHYRCGLVPRYVFDRITKMRVPRNAKSLISVYSQTDGINVVKFVLEDGTFVECLYYHPYPFKDAPMSEQRDVLLKFWQDLDAAIDRVNQVCTNAIEVADQNTARIQARTYCEMLAFLMHRFYEDGNSVGREAMARYHARTAGVEHDTPGLAENLWDPATRFDGTPYSKESEAKVRTGGRATKTAPKRTGKRIPDEAVDGVTQSLGSGMFTLTQIAGIYSMTEAEVKEQLGLA